MENFPTLKTNRLVLRKLTESDIPAVYDIFSNPDVTEHYDCYPFTERSEAVDWVNYQLASYKQTGTRGLRWAIAFQDNPSQLIGSCGYHSVNKNFKSFEVGYELHPDFWGKGIANEAMQAVIGFCFEQDFPFKVNRISAMTDVVSPQSISVLNKLGFQYEGIIREYGYWKDQFHDVRLYSLLRKDWNLFCQKGVGVEPSKQPN